MVQIDINVLCLVLLLQTCPFYFLFFLVSKTRWIRKSRTEIFDKSALGRKTIIKTKNNGRLFS